MNNERWYQDLSVRNANRDYTGIISAISENYLNVPSHLQYVHIHYSLAMAYIAQGNPLAGISNLKIILNQIEKLTLDSNGEFFVSKIQMQLELLEGFFNNVLLFWENKHLDAATKIRDYAAQTGDQVLSTAAEIVMNQWHRVDTAEGACFVPRSPNMLQIEPTNICNMRCTMCPREKMKRTMGFMDIDLFRNIFNGWSSKYLTLPLEHLVFGGTINAIRRGAIKFFFMGEPLLHDSFSEMIEIVKKEGCTIVLQTNGLLLNDEFICENLLKAKPNVIGISIDGMSESSYEKVRRGSSYQMILNNVKNLYCARESLGLSKDINIFISTIVADHSEDAYNKAEVFLKPMAQFADRILYISLTRNREPVFFNSEGKMELMKSMQNSVNEEVFFCKEPLGKLNVLWNGDITPCCYDIDGVLKLGHSTDGIDRIWTGQQTVKLHNAILNNDSSEFPLCRECKNTL